MKFLIITDTHIIDQRTDFNNNLDTIQEFAKVNPVDGIIHLGDIAADAPGNPKQLEFAAQSMQAFGLPIHFVPGNHDVGDNPMEPGAPVSEGRVTPETLASYSSVFGPDHWSLDVAGWQIVGLNAQLFGTDSAEEDAQFAWLEQTLAASDKPLGLASHKPFFRNGHDDTEVHARYIPELRRRRLVEMLSKRDFKFVLSGHAHQQREVRVDGVEHIWVPSAAFCIPDGMQQKVGDKVVGIGMLELMPNGAFRFERPVVQGLVRHNILHHPEVYPQLAAVRERLGAEAEL